MSDDHASDHDEDAALFRRYVQGVKPQRPEKVFLPTCRPVRTPAADVSDVSPHWGVAQTASAEEVPEYVYCVQAGLQHKLLRRLKTGRIACESVLDLHGLNRQQAAQALETFLQQSCHRKRRCVTVIHGKGNRSRGHGTAVLKRAIVNGLRHDSRVLAFCSATPRDGGTGALYLLLRR